MQKKKFKTKIKSMDNYILVLEVYPYMKRWFEDVKKDQDCTVEIYEYKPQRTLSQNAKIWKLIDEIDTQLNGLRSEKGMWNVYKQLIQNARIRTEYLQMTTKAAEALKEKGLFRIIELVEQRGKANLYRCYYESLNSIQKR